MIRDVYHFACLLVFLCVRLSTSHDSFNKLKDFSVNSFDGEILQKAEVIDECEIGSSDCGTGSSATCALDDRLKKNYCKCKDSKKRFDYDDKTCVDCECDSAIDCEIRNKKKICTCPYNYFYNGEKCEECKCGLHSSGCKASDDGEKICFCHKMYKQRINACLECDCGFYEGNCSFTSSGVKSCSCEPGFAMDTYKGICTEMCNKTNACRNGGTCHKGACHCPDDYTGSWCETPTWCVDGKCGFEDDVECVWDRVLKKGECRCQKDNYYYRPKDKKCNECHCGKHGSCHLVDDVLVCKCDKYYALKSSKCEICDCGPGSERCSFDSADYQVCQCQEGYATKTTKWPSLRTTCEICACGDRGKCRWEGGEKICDCAGGYKLFGTTCRECDCGRHGTCQFDDRGDRICTCDYGFAEKDGTCQMCDCNYLSTRRITGINCSFVDGIKQCHCSPGFVTGRDFCEDVNECYTNNPCPANSLCTNKPGTFECRCKEGYRVSATTLSGCEDIDECLDFPCTSHVTRCVNTPGSFDCVCREGYHPTSGTFGSSYKPAYNTCHESETQWREATIALGVILSIGIIGVLCYIKIHKQRS